MVAKGIELTDMTERFTVHGMTCDACAEHVAAALRAVPGVRSAHVDYPSATAVVQHRLDTGLSRRLQQTVASAGYTLAPLRGTRRLPLAVRPLLFGSLAGGGLLVFYLGIITWAQGWAHATQQLTDDRWFVGAIMAGFGTQIGLFTYLRELHSRTAARGVAVSTGTSTAAMLACCAHHLADILPVIGLSGAAVFLNQYRTPLLWLGITMNLIGIAYLLWRVRQQRLLERAIGPVHPHHGAERHETLA